MQLQSPKVKASRARSRDTGQSRGPMTHGSNTIVMLVPTALHLIQARCSKERKCQDKMGNVQVTVQNLEIVRVDTENNLLLVKGAVPGPKKIFGK